jgi:tRNA pseudouridine55 synthase
MDGVINFLKPPGMSSNAAVVLLRKLLNIQKIGHTGTLDPGACGVLPICVGKATRISAYMMDGKKEYVAEIAFGKSTDTGDSYGAVTEASPAEPPSDVAVINALQGFLGRITQQTPAYSAAKVEGKKRYELARRGETPPPQYRNVEIYEIEYLGRTGPDAHRFRVMCGKGTYIRTLCEDIGKALGQPAYMSFLARTKCAGLEIAGAVTADELQRGNAADRLLPMEPFLSSLPRADASAEQRKQLFHGVSVPTTIPDFETACIFAGGELMGIGSVKDGMAKINTRLVDGE